MSEFVGRTGSNRVYSYPESRRDTTVPYARNFATGPKINLDIGIAGFRIPWNAVDVPPTPTVFTIAAGGVTVSVAGDVTALFSDGDTIDLTPTAPVAGPSVSRTIVTPPAFLAGFTTWNLNSAINGSTMAGTLVNRSNVPITPRSTGVVIVSGVVSIQNQSGFTLPDGALVYVQVDGIAVPVPLTTVAAPLVDTEAVSIPFLVEVSGLTVGTTYNIEVFVGGNTATLIAEASSINVQEVSLATG